MLRIPKLALVLAICMAATAEDKPIQKVSKVWLTRCNTGKAINFGTTLNKFKLQKGDQYRNSPVVAFLIQPDGSVTGAKITRTSGIQRLDEQLLKSTAGWKYKSRPQDCGAVDTSMSITIDWDAGH